MKEREYIDQYEKDIIESFENDEWKSIKNIDEYMLFSILNLWMVY